MSIQGPSMLYDASAPSAAAPSFVVPPPTPPAPVQPTEAATATVSPWAKLLSKLQHLQQTDPAAFKKTVDQLSRTVTAVAATAASDQKASLSKLGEQLAHVAKTGDLPALKPLKHHHHARSHPASGGTMSLLQALLEQVDHVLGPGAIAITNVTTL